MRTLRSRLAFVLLLCFARVLVPDAWVLALHAHEHTVEAPASTTARHKAHLSAQHQHCAVDHFYDVPFQLASPLELAALAPGFRVPVGTPLASVWASAHSSTADLRGPPSRL
ncbi:hypothetical protein KLP40_08105 [Hymenobacter sp. NST-14]|uniref:hypothetical protein n=1 Tax=Hymenobacter piscis TaxID=2839984 RepID=UPI001C032872|nr:hypothetical protein [Hymenobacter piscis]MBT9393124.1 hypothetical protein [Hymenobacter piscis]